MSAHFKLAPAPNRPPASCSDREVVIERQRIDRQVCRHHDGRVGYVDGVYSDGLAVFAKLWRDGRYDPVRACRVEPANGEGEI